MLAARAKGVPIIAVANLQQDNGAAWIATEKSGITKVEDLKGRNVGILPGSTTTIFLQALMKKHGLTMDDVKPITLGMYEFVGAHVSDWGAVMATAVISAVPAAILLVVAQKYVAAGVTGGAVK